MSKPRPESPKAGQTAWQDDITIARISRRSAADEVREQLVHLIESGKFKINEKLPSENELAREFGVSRPVIREALVGLSALGLTTAHTGRGTFVTANRLRTPLLLGRFPPALLNEARHYLEVPAARLAAERRTDEDIGHMAQIIARMEDSDDPRDRNKLDAEFHVSIALATSNPVMVRMIEDLRALLEEHALAASAVPNRRAGASEEHRAIYDAILRRDPDLAGKAMAQHLNAVDNAFIGLAAGKKAPRRK